MIDYVVRTNQLPSIVQDLVHLGFELYTSQESDGKQRSIQVQAFDQLFQKMNLGRPFAIMAYKYLTDVRVLFEISLSSFFFLLVFRMEPNHWMEKRLIRLLKQ